MRSGERALAWRRSARPPRWPTQLGDAASLARAAVGASRRYVQQPGVVDEELIGMLERALAMTAGERSVMRVRLLARLCGALYYSTAAGSDERAERGGEAIAARAGRSRGAALARRGPPAGALGPGAPRASGWRTRPRC